ncbi:MAG: hypothetical protein Q8O67_04910 [Deltaproteobacteria bacterium]|nr:hypothetical protein [Deltaproteobacteria bacterium]
MRATAVRFLVVVVVAAFSPEVLAGARIFVTPILNDTNPGSSQTLSRAVETAVKAALPDAEIVTTSALDTAIEMSTMRDCVGSAGPDDGADSCLSELADAIDVDYIARPHLGRVGRELVLTLSLLDGRRAVVLAQGHRRVAMDSPGALLDVVNGLAKEVVRAADLRSDRPRARVVPITPIIAAGGGVVGVGVGALALGVRGSLSGDYERARLDRGQAQFYELIDAPFLWGGIGLVVVGGVVALAGGGIAVLTVVNEGE